jgi:predicted O-linked N-acetylglucosamine transferase (SPINDLY family)
MHSIAPHNNDRQPDRRLRIGYVSPDFRSHVVGWNLLPLLERHDHAQFEVFAYTAATSEDALTAKLRARCDVWRDIRAMTNQQAADLVRADSIDILVDLSLHMAHNRLLLFARKPAPVQVTYLAYCSTSGLSQIDYRFSDPHLDPDENAPVYSEKTVRLPKSYWCYQPPDAPPIAPAPLLANGFPTFGCLNSFAKASPSFLDLCAQILGSHPRSRMILYCPPGAHRSGVLQRFATRGVDADRIEMLGKQPWLDYIRTYNRIDIALDPFPHGGGITTCDALWMGVPVVTLSGQTAVGRGGRSILSNLGLPELVANSREEYAHLVGDFGRWIQLRGDLRERMSASPLLDSAAFARDVEQAYRQMWRLYCRETA